MLDRHELNGYRCVILSRTSNKSKKSQSSLNRQVRRLTGEADSLKENYDGEVVEVFQNKQSASSMDRETLDEILLMAKNNKFDILMVWAIHRLTRADPLETMKYLIKLADQGITLYSHREGYYDWEDPDDTTRLMDRISSARSWRNEIQRGAIDANKDILMDGHWPYGPIGYGLVDDDEKGIMTKEGYDEVIRSVYETYLKCEDEEQTAVSIANKIQSNNLGIEPPSDNQVENILENELYMGELVARKTGELVREKSEIKIIDSDTYHKIQNLRSEPEESSIDLDEEDLPSEIYNLICRFGQEYVVENVSAIRWCCPECESTDINVSDTMIDSLDIHIPRIYCKNDDCSPDDESPYQGPAIRTRELYKIDMSLPFVCPECQRTDGFEVEAITEIDNQQMYKYTCEHCGGSMIKSSEPDPNVRGLHSPNAISLRNGNEQTENESTEDQQVEPDDLENEDVSHPEFTAVLEEYLERAGPNKSVACDVMITAANILADDGPMTTADLKHKLNKSHGEEYASMDSLWESTFSRLYSEIPGFTKVSYGKYTFDEQRLNCLIDSILES